MEQSVGVMAWIADQLDAVINGGRAEGILSVIADAVRSGDIDAGEGFAVMATLLSAGGESTTGLLGNALHLLATRPELQLRVRADPGVLKPFIEETLRLESPFRYHLRHATVTTDLRGVEVPAGAVILLLWGAANRDPSEYERPDDVVLDRPAPRHHLAFGRGIHLCVGAPLARLEAEVILTEVLDQTSHFELDSHDLPEREHSLVVRRFRRLPLRMTAT
jgi:cytochrome P450